MKTEKKVDKDYLLVKEWQNNHDPLILKQIFERHVAMIKQLFFHNYHSTVNKDDLMSEGLLGILIAANKFKIEKNAKFSTYAYYWIRSKINRSAEKIRKMEKESPPQNTEYNWEEFIPEEHDFVEEHKHLQIALSRLEPREKKIIQLRFLDEKKLTIIEISKKLNLSKERIRQLLTISIEKLKNHLIALM